MRMHIRSIYKAAGSTCETCLSDENHFFEMDGEPYDEDNAVLRVKKTFHACFSQSCLNHAGRADCFAILQPDGPVGGCYLANFTAAKLVIARCAGLGMIANQSTQGQYG